jgi:hypothetical protein
MTEIKNAFLAFFLALGGHEQPSTAPDPSAPEPSALVAEHRPLTAGMLVGAWRGQRVKAGERTASPMEAVLVDAARPSSLLGYFTFGEGDSALTVRRLGRLTGDRLTFTLRDGREMTLRLDDKQTRLLGSETETGGQAATFELSRLRPRTR